MKPQEEPIQEECKVYDFCEAQSDKLAYGRLPKGKNYIKEGSDNEEAAS